MIKCPLGLKNAGYPLKTQPGCHIWCLGFQSRCRSASCIATNCRILHRIPTSQSDPAQLRMTIFWQTRSFSRGTQWLWEKHKTTKMHTPWEEIGIWQRFESLGTDQNIMHQNPLWLGNIILHSLFLNMTYTVPSSIFDEWPALPLPNRFRSTPAPTVGMKSKARTEEWRPAPPLAEMHVAWKWGRALGNGMRIVSTQLKKNNLNYCCDFQCQSLYKLEHFPAQEMSKTRLACRARSPTFGHFILQRRYMRESKSIDSGILQKSPQHYFYIFDPCIAAGDRSVATLQSHAMTWHVTCASLTRRNWIWFNVSKRSNSIQRNFNAWNFQQESILSHQSWPQTSQGFGLVSWI